MVKVTYEKIQEAVARFFDADVKDEDTRRKLQEAVVAFCNHQDYDQLVNDKIKPQCIGLAMSSIDVQTFRKCLTDGRIPLKWEGTVLVVKEEINGVDGYWMQVRHNGSIGFIGGYLRRGEKALQCAEREYQEETFAKRVPEMNYLGYLDGPETVAFYPHYESRLWVDINWATVHCYQLNVKKGRSIFKKASLETTEGETKQMLWIPASQLKEKMANGNGFNTHVYIAQQLGCF